MKLIYTRNINGDDLAINVAEIRAFYQYRNPTNNLTASSVVAVDIGSPNILLVKKSFIEFNNLINSALS